MVSPLARQAAALLVCLLEVAALLVWVAALRWAQAVPLPVECRPQEAEVCPPTRG